MSIEHFPKIFEKLASEIESGPGDEHFTDPRGGFLASLERVQVFLERSEVSSENMKFAQSLLSGCRELLSNVEVSGWSGPTKLAANTLINQIRCQSWQ